MNLDITNRPLLRAFRATLAYDGSAFFGSQLQKSDRTVLSDINRALGKVLGHPMRAKIASRTDAGVHATGQVISFRTSAPRAPDEIRRALNGMLAGDVRVTDCRESDFDFHPRYSAVGKVYLYRILRARELPPTFRNHVLFIEEHKPFDLEKLRALGKQLEGNLDYRSFSPRLENGENPVKTIWRVAVAEAPPIVEVRFIGSGFLYQMVRRMMGLMIAIVQGRERDDSVKKALGHPEKGSARFNASPAGLFLERVLYSEAEVQEAIENTVGSCDAGNT